ncbi:hypothetical protein M4I21_04990 [Cellulophaga sp. 20_2_10]|uniref:hypothetical protein n=1 Tax=Cellulophaga sp. 20_2_10 TaxID=2942476 RepID=UPI00201A5A3F|nr:hypothetical protein [Cellulophaga sp. 20_2_10]MCL5245153.1 hypothetical protein [Cellulophaga sp. 20_2_10]
MKTEKRHLLLRALFFIFWLVIGLGISVFISLNYDSGYTMENRQNCGMGTGFLIAIYTMGFFYISGMLFVLIEAYLFNKKKEITKRNKNLLLFSLQVLVLLLFII